jgi:hypothetical protein
MKITPSAVLQSILITQTLGCAHATHSPSSPPDIRKSPERCTLPLLNTQEVVVAVLRDLSTFYTAVDGTIIKVENVETGQYEVWVSHNERIDVVMFEATASPTCDVKVHRIGERAISKRATP